MFQSISWSQYFFILSIATIIYYLVVWVLFFQARIPSFIRAGNIGNRSPHGEDQPDEVITTAQHILDEVRPVFEGRGNKNELILALQIKLRRYNQWDEPGFRETINAFIMEQSQSKCSIRLGEDDLRIVWQ